MPLVRTPTPGASFPGTDTQGVGGRRVVVRIPAAVAAAVGLLEFRSSVIEWELKKSAKMVLDSHKNELRKLFICPYSIPIIG